MYNSNSSKANIIFLARDHILITNIFSLDTFKGVKVKQLFNNVNINKR